MYFYTIFQQNDAICEIKKLVNPLALKFESTALRPQVKFFFLNLNSMKNYLIPIHTKNDPKQRQRVNLC